MSLSNLANITKAKSKNRFGDMNHDAPFPELPTPNKEALILAPKKPAQRPIRFETTFNQSTIDALEFLASHYTKTTRKKHYANTVLEKALRLLMQQEGF